VFQLDNGLLKRRRWPEIDEVLLIHIRQVFNLYTCGNGGNKLLGLEELGLEELGIEELGIEELGIEELGIEELGLEKVGDGEPKTVT
jgi:hypothetical protein